MKHLCVETIVCFVLAKQPNQHYLTLTKPVLIQSDILWNPVDYGCNDMILTVLIVS